MAGDRLPAQAGGGVALRVEVDQQGLATGLGQRAGQVQGGGRLADAAFLVCHTQGPTHDASMRFGSRNGTQPTGGL